MTAVVYAVVALYPDRAGTKEVFTSYVAARDRAFDLMKAEPDTILVIPSDHLAPRMYRKSRNYFAEEVK